MSALLYLLQIARWLTLAAIFLVSLLASKELSIAPQLEELNTSRSEVLPEANHFSSNTSLASDSINLSRNGAIVTSAINENPISKPLTIYQAKQSKSSNEAASVLSSAMGKSKSANVSTMPLKRRQASESKIVSQDSKLMPNMQLLPSSKPTQTSVLSMMTQDSVIDSRSNQTMSGSKIGEIASAKLQCVGQLAIPYQNQVTQESLFLVTQLNYAKMQLSNEMFVYQQNGMQYLPLEYIAELLHLPIQVDIDTLSANGWFIEESHLVDISQDLMVFRNISDNCDKSETIVYHDSWDLYIESRVLEQLLGLAVSFDSARQKFDIQASKHIPLTLLLERQKRFELFNAQKKNNQSRPVKKISKEYALLGDLAVNADIGVRTQSLNDIKHTEADAFLQTRADLLGHNTYAAYSQSASGSSFNAYLERELQEQWVNFYRIGNVDSHSLSLVSDSVLGVGAIVSAGSTFTGDLRSIVVEGELDPDWDVELYRNNTLVGVQRVKSDGQYRFADVPYYIGLNQYQLRFYGPNGEIRTESFSKLLDSSLLEKGNVGVNFGAMARELDDLKQYYADVNWALADDMTVGLALVQQQNTLKEWQFLPRLSVNFVGDSQLVQLNYVNSPTGYATSVAIQGSQSELDWQAEWQKYSNYSTWDNIDGRIDQEALINISGSLDGSTLNWGFGARWQAVNLGSDNTQANFLLSSQFNALSLSNDLRWSSLNSIGRWSDRLAISGRINNWQIRSYVDLDIAPELSLNQWNTNFNTALTDRANYQLELGYQPNGSSDFTVRNSISYLFDYGALRLELDNRSNGDWLAQMKWNSAFLWDTEPDRWLVDRMSYINTGSVKIIAFQDDNANGLFDDIELPISGLKFTGHSQSNKQTDLNGELLITQLQTNRQQKLVLNENSLKDPFLLPAAHIISVNPHPGHIQPILFPVMYTAELEGEVVFDDKDNSPASGVFVELRAKSSDISNSTRVEYDGIFILDQMLPGEYELFINDIFIQTVKLTPGDFIQLPKFTIERQTNS